MKSEIAQRQEKARDLMSNKGFSGLVLATAQNIQDFTGVLETSVQTCGVVVFAQQPQPALAVLWLDAEAAQGEAEGVSVETYTPTTQGKVIAAILERLGCTKGTIGMDDRAMRSVGNAVRGSLPDAEPVNASLMIEEELRSVKSEEEIRYIQKACQIAEQGMKAAAASLKPGVTELEVAAVAESQMIKLGSDILRHTTVVASGSRIRLIHAFATQKKVESGDIVAIDLGAVYRGYCSDLARTFVVGNPDEELKKGFEVFRGAQDALLQKIRPGESIHELQEVPRKAAEAAGHGLVGHVGHNMGLQVEEHPFVMGAASPEQDREIKENNVLAFFQGSIKREQNLGIRLEDTVLVTDSGAKLLTNYPRELFVC